MGSHRLTDRILSVGSLGGLIVTLPVINEDVRRQLLTFASGGGSTQLPVSVEQLQEAAHVVRDTLIGHGGGNSPLVLFAVGAAALFLVMFRQ